MTELSEMDKFTKQVITRGDFIDAVEKNGWPQRTDSFFYKNTELGEKKWYGYRDLNISEISGACAVGQGMLNLGVTETRFEGLSPDNSRFLQKLVYMNDIDELTIPEIVKKARRVFKDTLNSPLRVNGRWV